ncbi:hypothetical protein PNK_p0051 (plasmid) [Candidatus Protochlamydia naegleriophila]|uniref:Uncharacterized protein n=1 Tax=Candidatus Protochlamydia naegleriophila TaxID=389348 RepID=A0A0U5JDQ9_9BACT|nr:hypothetical protein PNK_p0051 [Candidatus Protochlamydia naegleriophila]
MSNEEESLRKACYNYKIFGASYRRFKNDIRLPLPDEFLNSFDISKMERMPGRIGTFL